MKLLLAWLTKNVLLLPHYVVWDNPETFMHGLENAMITQLQLPTGPGLQAHPLNQGKILSPFTFSLVLQQSLAV